jgi:hypothetical protein
LHFVIVNLAAPSSLCTFTQCTTPLGFLTHWAGHRKKSAFYYDIPLVICIVLLAIYRYFTVWVGHAWCSGCHFRGIGIPLHFVFWVDPLDLADFYGHLYQKDRYLTVKTSYTHLPLYYYLSIHHILPNHQLPCLALCEQMFVTHNPIHPSGPYTLLFLRHYQSFQRRRSPKATAPACKPHMASETQSTLSHLRSVSNTCFCVSNQFHIFTHPLCHISSPLPSRYHTLSRRLITVLD